jgi:hypothetical protein
MEKKTKIILGATFTIAFILGIVLFVKARNKSKSLNNTRSLDPEVEDKALSDKFNFHLIPDGLNNYRSAQITADAFPEIIKKYGIKHIIRLNGDGVDSQHKASYGQTPQSVEQKICEENGCMYHKVNAHKGYRKAHKTGVLDAGAKYQKIGANPDEAQMIEARKLAIEEIARMFRVPPHMIGITTAGAMSYASVEQNNINFVTHT